jgi:hypothetical protein
VFAIKIRFIIGEKQKATNNTITKSKVSEIKTTQRSKPSLIQVISKIRRKHIFK